MNTVSETKENDALYQNEALLQSMHNILRQGAVLTRSRGVTLQILTIIGQIEGHSMLPEHQKTTKYEHLMPLLVASEENDAVDGLLILLNTAGGDVEAGLALSELIAGMKKPTVSLVLGGGHSIGVPLAVSAKKSFIVPSASMTLHPVRANGLVLGAPQSFWYFEKIQERIIRFVTDHSEISPDRLRELLFCTDELATDMGSILTGDEAVNEHLIDHVGSLSMALDSLHKMISEAKNEK